MARSRETNLATQLLYASVTGCSSRLARSVSLSRLGHLSISRHVSIHSSRVGGVKWLDLDTVEQRYLLAASADSSIEALDVLAADAGCFCHHTQQQHVVRPVFSIKRQHPSAHRYHVTCVAWYPVDTGMFVSGSADQEVKVWDTNMLEVACAFSCPDKVMAVGMSSCATSHALIAVATKKPQLVLADIVSGAFSHTLSGHKAGVWSVCWSPDNEHQLYSGDGSGEVRLWDIRRSGCRALLDMLVTERPQHSVDFLADQQAGLTSASAARGSSASLGKRKAPRAASSAGTLQDDAGCSGGSSSVTRKVAHEAAVTGIHAALDGLNLITSGCDSRVRLWDRQYLHHQLVHFSDTWNRGAYPKRMSSTPDGRLLFLPRGDDIQVFDVATGRLVALLSQGHFDTVTACIYSPLTGQLWSAGIDGTVIVWEPWQEEQQEAEVTGSEHPADWWLAAAAGRRGRLPPQQPPQAGPAGLATGGGGSVAGARPVVADVDAWSDDDFG